MSGELRFPRNLAHRVFHEPGIVGRGTTRHPARTFVITGEHRPPRAGEWYVSGAEPACYQMPNDGSSPVWIAREYVRVVCKACAGSGYEPIKHDK